MHVALLILVTLYDLSVVFEAFIINKSPCKMSAKLINVNDWKTFCILITCQNEVYGCFPNCRAMEKANGGLTGNVQTFKLT